MHTRHRITVSLGLLTLLAGACRSPQPAPPTLAPLLQIDLPTPTAPTSSTAPLPPRPKSPEEMAAIAKMLREADALYFSGKAKEACAQFEAAWEKHHPSPLTLVMAAFASKRAGDRVAADALLERARKEARQTPAPDECNRGEFGFATFDGPGSAWIKDEQSWVRVDTRGRRQLFGFCGQGTRDPALRPGAPVTWMPSVISANWQHPDAKQAESSNSGMAIDLLDIAFGGIVGSVPHQVDHFDFNEGYHGTISFSADDTLLASAANGPDHELRVWRVSDRSLVKAIRLPDDSAQALRLSPDGSHVAMADCSSLTIWNTKTGAKVSKLDYRYISCAYGSGIGSSVYTLAFSPDNTLLAVSHLPMGSGRTRPPESEAMPLVSLVRVRDGKRVRRLNDGEVWGLLFSPDSSLLMTGQAHGQGLIAYDVKTGKSQRIADKGYATRFSPDGHTLVFSGGLADVSEPKKIVQVMDYDAQHDLEAIGPYLIPTTLGAP